MDREEFITRMKKLSDDCNTLTGIVSNQLNPMQFAYLKISDLAPWDEYADLVEYNAFGVEDGILKTALYDYDGVFPMTFDTKDFSSLEDTITAESWGDLYDKLVY